MVFKIIDFVYFLFWLAIWNAVIFLEAVVRSNQWGPLQVIQNHFKFIRQIPVTGRWSEVTSALRQFTVHMGAYTLFTFKGLVDFLILAEE